LEEAKRIESFFERIRCRVVIAFKTLSNFVRTATWSPDDHALEAVSSDIGLGGRVIGSSD